MTPYDARSRLALIETFPFRVPKKGGVGLKLARQKEKRTCLCWLAVAFAVAVVCAPAAAQPIPLKANECNARIDIALAATSIAPGMVVGVTLTHTNVDSRDNADNPIGQTLTEMGFTPACMTAGSSPRRATWPCWPAR